MNDLVYVYAILRHPLAEAFEGIDGRPLRWVLNDAGNLAAAVTDVPADEFDEEPLNARVRDLSWLGARAVAHQAVNERLWARSSGSLPLAFGTVFRDDSRVRQLLQDEADSLRQRLERVSGRGEWVVALHRVTASTADELDRSSQQLQRLHAEIESSTPGRAHLLRRQAATLERDEARRLDLEAAASLEELLRGVAEDVFREPLPTEDVERPLARLSALVKRQDETTFLDIIDSVRRRWPEPTYRVLLTGPWPPYRFAGLAHADG
jgi:hypothetical protein